MKSWAAIFSLYRWPNCLLSMSVVICAGFLLPDLPGLESMIFAAFCVAFITAWGNGINDIKDIESDKINHPKRPLPSGRLTVRKAWAASVFALIAGTLLAALINLNCLIIAVLAALMLLAYSLGLKSIPLLSNVWIALISALTFVFAGLVSAQFHLFTLNLVNAGAVFAFWFHLARELTKDLQDLKGDRQSGVKTVAAVLPGKMAKSLITACFATVIATAFGVHFYLKPDVLFIVLFLFGMVLPLFYASMKLWTAKSSRNFAHVAALLKVLMPVGLLILLIAAL